MIDAHYVGSAQGQAQVRKADQPDDLFYWGGCVRIYKLSSAKIKIAKIQIGKIRTWSELKHARCSALRLVGVISSWERWKLPWNSEEFPEETYNFLYHTKQERTISDACFLTHFVSQMFNSFQSPRRTDLMWPWCHINHVKNRDQWKTLKLFEHYLMASSGLHCLYWPPVASEVGSDVAQAPIWDQMANVISAFLFKVASLMVYQCVQFSTV